jgi:hypothetical protein
VLHITPNRIMSDWGASVHSARWPYSTGPFAHSGLPQMSAQAKQGTVADVDREVGPGEIIQFDQTKAFQVFGVSRTFRGFAGTSEGNFAALGFIALEEGQTSILPLRRVVPTLHDGMLITGLLSPRASAACWPFPGGVS